MEIGSSEAANALFSAINDRSSTIATLSNAALSRGIDLYQNGDYEGSVSEFKRVIGLEQNSDNAMKAYNYAGMAYLQLDRPDDAIKTYKTAIRVSPTDDSLHLALGNIYFDQNNYTDAEKEYQAAVKLNSQSTTNWYSLGQAYLVTNKYNEAEDAFTKVKQISPRDYSGYYGLGQVSYKRGEYSDAIQQFRKVLEMKHNFTAAYVDLGYAYADMGDLDKARQQLKNLNNADDTDSANLLSSYIYKVSSPEILAAYTTGGFNVALGPGTKLSDLDSSLSSPGASESFTMDFIFSKNMDSASVQNPYNWQINRAAFGTPGGAYDWGLPVSSSDVPVALNPVSVVYKSDSLTAEVTFQINQNATADGTIDPSHIIFKFAGKDVYGNAMSSAADEYGGFSKIV
jgi:tetratricopeptide (TPR) repeat protein